MTTKKQSPKKQIKNAQVRDIGLRLTTQQIDLLDRAVEIVNERDGTPSRSRAQIVVNAVIIAARKIIADAGEK